MLGNILAMFRKPRLPSGTFAGTLACPSPRILGELAINLPSKQKDFECVFGPPECRKARREKGFYCVDLKIATVEFNSQLAAKSISRTWVRFGFDNGYSPFLSVLKQCYAYRKMNHLA